MQVEVKVKAEAEVEVEEKLVKKSSTCLIRYLFLSGF